jgi:hypothetical protein
VAANPVNQVALNPAVGAVQVAQDSSVLQRMDQRLAQPFLVGFSNSMDLVFLIAACVIVVGFVLVLFLREVPLRTQSGIQARDAEGAGAPTPTAAAVGGSTAGASALNTVDNATPVPAASAAGNGSNGTAPRSEPSWGPPSTADAPPMQAPWRVTGRAVHGRVTGSAGSPVTAHDEVTVSLHGLDGAPIARTELDAHGAFALRAPESGTYVLIASSPRRRPFAELVSVDGVPVRRDVALARATTVGGRVTEPDGTPVVGATVTVTDPAGGVVAVRHSDADGAWESGETEPGTYTVTVLAPGRAPHATRVVVGEDGAREDVTVPPARYALSGAVRAAGGAPVPESLVVLVARDGGVVASAVTGPDGRFRLDDVAPGRHMLTASGFAPVTEQVLVDPGTGPTDVTLTVTPPRPAGPGHEGGRHEARGTAPGPGHDPADLTRTAH